MAQQKIKYYRNNPLLKGTGVQLEYTKEQIEEYLKCKNDPIYFIKNYVKIVHVDKGLVSFELYDFQEEMISLMHNNRKVCINASRQIGKCLFADSILTIKNVNYNNGLPFEISIIDFYIWNKICSTPSGWKSYCDKYLYNSTYMGKENENNTTSNK